MRLIVGLGNPGEEYVITRHNLGFIALDMLLDHLGGGEWRAFKGGEVAEVMLKGQKVLFFKPMQYMNASGFPVRQVVDYYNIAAEDICVIADDVYVAPGSARIRRSGGDGGHNGWKSVIAHVPDTFWRLRIGAGLYEQHPLKRGRQPSLDAYVLQPLPKHEQKSVETLIDIILPKLVQWLSTGEMVEETIHLT